MCFYVNFLLLLFSCSQTCHGSDMDTIRHLLEEKVEEAFKVLVHPVITEVNRLNQTIIIIEKFLEKRKLNNLHPAEQKGKNLIFPNEDSCKNLTDYLPKAKSIVENAFYLCSDIGGALSGLIVDGLDCISTIDVIKAIKCLLNEINELQDIGQKYEPQVVNTIQNLKVMIVTLYDLFEECIKV